MQLSAPKPPVMLLLGGTGQVGFELRRSLAPLGRLVVPTRQDVDLARPNDLRRIIRGTRPELIVCAAAYTAVDAAESHRQLAHAVNGVAPAVIAEEAAKLGAAIVHYSTDYVFDGTKTEPYVESDAVHPLSVYGETKAFGEAAIVASDTRHLILRTSWVFGARGSNFAKTILRVAREQRSLQVVVDQIGAPTSAALIADVTAHAIRSNWQSACTKFPSGIYHVAAAGAISRHAYACELLRMAARRGMPLLAGPDAVTAIATQASSAVAQRPANSRLDTTRFTHTFALCMPDWRDGVEHWMDQLSVAW